MKYNFIPIFDSLCSDNRYLDLVLKCGGQFMADGMFVCAARLAHKYWLDEEKPRQLIPKSAFLNCGLKILLDVGLAKEKEGGIYLRGIEAIADKRLQNYDNIIKQRSEAGKRSAEQRKQKYGSAIPFSATNNISEQNPNEKSKKPNETELSKDKISKEYNTVSKKDTVIGDDIRKLYAWFIKNYEQCLNIKYNVNYGKDCKLLKQLLKIYSADELAYYMQMFFESTDDFIKKTDYSFGVFKTQLNKLMLEFKYQGL